MFLFLTGFKHQKPYQNHNLAPITKNAENVKTRLRLNTFHYNEVVFLLTLKKNLELTKGKISAQSCSRRQSKSNFRNPRYARTMNTERKKIQPVTVNVMNFSSRLFF